MDNKLYMQERGPLTEFEELFQDADWKKEKHVPLIECQDEVKPDKYFKIKVTVGKEVAHPNTTQHHIRWTSLYFLPEGEKFPYQIGHFEFSAHGSSAQGPDTSTVYTYSGLTVYMKTSKPGTLTALSYCNIHGLWKSSKEVKLLKKIFRKR